MMTRVMRIDAPAKINLGLEILGKREDGYHEIRTIMAMIDLADTLTFTADDTLADGSLRVDGVDLPSTDNLIVRAHALIGEHLDLPGVRIAVTKRIPMAAGLGGASADAAATLLALNELAGEDVPDTELAAMAARLGSDVPFFLDTPVALATGTGTDLAPLPNVAGTLVLITPNVDIPRKTVALYGSLTREDRSDGATVDAQVARITNGDPLDPALLGNAFTRPLAIHAPVVTTIRAAMRDAGAPFVALSGAGPTHYTIVPTRDAADEIATALRPLVPSDTQIVIATFRQTPLLLHEGREP